MPITIAMLDSDQSTLSDTEKLQSAKWCLILYILQFRGIT